MNKTNKLPISVVMVVHNEEKTIGKALSSIKGVTDDIIIVHDGPCRDNTIKIARKYTSHVFIQPFNGEAEYHRVFTYQKAKYNWILQLDADESISTELRLDLPNLIRDKFDLYQVAWKTIMPDGRGWFLKYKSVLFDKRKVYYIGGVHEYIKPLNNKIRQRFLLAPIIHQPSKIDLTILVFKKKWNQWGKIHVQNYIQGPKSLPRWNYDASEWDYPTNIKLKNPLLIGAFGSLVYKILLGVGTYRLPMSPLYIWQEVMMGFYLFLVYFRVFLFRIQRS